jgi:hypothetical protein
LRLSQCFAHESFIAWQIDHHFSCSCSHGALSPCAKA